jgi:glyoxylase-like metal-dependent hydrolase (beta-lactamase superfamily II)
VPALKVHHINCTTMCPPMAKRVVNSHGKMVCHVLVIETGDGLALVDTGLGVRDMFAPARVGAMFGLLTRPINDPEESALLQLRRLGFQQKDVRHIIATHLDLDHVGALPDFPDARVHVHEQEFLGATRPATRIEKARYKPVQWAHHPRWERYPTAGDKWFGLEAVRSLAGLPEGEILLVPLAGHTRGHAGVAVRSQRGWLLHAGDAYFHAGEMHPEREKCPPMMELFQASEQHDGVARARNRRRLRALKREHGREVTVFCAHDPSEFEQLA